ncbi:hypothetical protein [Thiorhodovibrio frisius]|uniref:Uncharacterized protein n=1 Tax=Thiorhodovibrio frisius TaxID=631362 RepID=H8YXV8_9GAMM|nr:hypothetical protein [Thiorhodovibrio frisius]EIC23284.1 hypothetical protein Thi970DRAFT_00941 [Thiorhodovibrio frisius]WPL23638.1 hypothetical protein Thiofri_03833 [Thiorhodovibrio frisius]
MNDYLSRLLTDNGAVEIRHQADGRWRSGWFDAIEPMVREIQRLGSRGNLYTSLNAPKPRRCPNAMAGDPVRNDDIGWLTRIPFDFDPVRPVGVCSTQTELDSALQRRDALVAMLRKSGWPRPLVACSGNGAHAQFRCRLPSSAETAEQFRAIYTGLALEFGDDEVGFDKTVRNPGRIFRLYGTCNRKGPHTAERPHRLATCDIPRPWSQVNHRLIDRLANRFARSQTPAQTPLNRPESRPRVSGHGDYATLDVVALTRSHGLYRHELGSGTHAIVCPWESEHSTPRGRSDTVIFENGPGKWPGFHCHHGHCQGRSIRDLIEVLGDADAFCSAPWTGRASA